MSENALKQQIQNLKKHNARLVRLRVMPVISSARRWMARASVYGSLMCPAEN
jgi:hypothetical protein